MKRIILVAAMTMMAGVGAVSAQDCMALVLPFFGGDSARMAEYPAEKFEWRCTYARNAFYVADSVPEGAVVRGLDEVRDRRSGEYLTEAFVVDLATLSYYAYNFKDLQQQYPKCDVTLCFPTPSSKHRYLVLRSLDDTYFRSAYPEQYKGR